MTTPEKRDTPKGKEEVLFVFLVVGGDLNKKGRVHYVHKGGCVTSTVYCWFLTTMVLGVEPIVVVAECGIAS